MIPFLLQVKNMLEPIVLKGTRWVLRREGVSNHSDLSDFKIFRDIMSFIIRELKNNSEEITAVKEFLYGQIMKEYGIGSTPKFHYDIDGIVDYYISPKDSGFFIALDGDKIVATAAVRAYDLNYDFFKDVYSKEDTASIWRLMVDEKYRRHGLARRLVSNIEEFARNAGYEKIYLHTHRYLESGILFWTSVGYEITVEEDDCDETTHMVKFLT